MRACTIPYIACFGLLTGAILLGLHQTPARADDRMAGARHNVAAPQNQPEPKNATKNATKPAADAQPGAETKPIKYTPPTSTPAKFSYKTLESYGTLENPLSGTIGIDMWDGSKRSLIVENLPLLPNGSAQAAIQALSLRLLLSAADADFVRNDVSPKAGQDLMTLRLEKLLDMGAYQPAMELYTQIAAAPYNERLARAGVTAMLYNGQTGLACLEFRSVEKTMSEDISAMPADSAAWWAAMAPICRMIQARTTDSKIPMPEFDETKLGGSKILMQLMARKNFTLNINEPDDFEKLTALERSILAGLHRYDYSRLKLRGLNDVDASVLMIMAEDPNMPAGLRAPLMAEALHRGLVTTDRLTALYDDTALDKGPLGGFARTWRALETAKKAETGPLLATLMDFNANTDNVAAYYPFAAALATAAPDQFPGRTLNNALRVMMLGGANPPQRWIKAWTARESVAESHDIESIQLGAALALLDNNARLLDIFSADELGALFTTPESRKTKEILAVFAGLEQKNTLHNITDPDAYEKLFDLTAPTDYVMPSGGLLEQLGKAAEDQRLGEVVLLASVTLDNSGRTPDTVHPAIMREALRSLVTVGFKTEAYDLAIGVILGFDE